MTCSEWFELVSAAADDQVSPDERARLDAHVASCPSCDALLSRFAAERRRGRFRPPTEHVQLVERVLSTAHERPRRTAAALRARTAAAAIVVVAALLGLAALPGPPTSTALASVAPTSVPDPVVRIDADGHTFDRADVEVAAGEAVEWRNAGEVTHHLVIAAGSTTLRDALAPGRSETATFTVPGTYRYWCSVHRGMEGTVTVDA
ncbi:MAG: zf-HC2 domain-containing protein [Acidimicrobiales bacterium]|nr:zf-HC2 domain-containing protein [Acidimicrobiales bacterium]